MADYKVLSKTTENQNWLKVVIAIHITKTGLSDFVSDAAVKLRDKIINDIQQGTNLPAGARCNKCNTCPEANCEKFRQMIKTYHRFQEPSWKNSNPDDWCTKPWEVAKCFFPGDGYREKVNAQETDFNGIVCFILKCMTFDGQTGENLSDIKGNKFSKCRQLVQHVSHSVTLEIKDADLKDYITQLKNLLTSGAVLQNNTRACHAHRQLTMLENDKLIITTDDIIKVKEDTLEETKQPTIKANKVNKEASNVNANTRDVQTKPKTPNDIEKQMPDAIKVIETQPVQTTEPTQEEEAETTPPTLTTSSLADLRIAEKESMSIEIDDKGIERTEVKRRTKETATQTTQLTQEEEEEPTLQDVRIVERGAGSLIGSEWTEVKLIETQPVQTTEPTQEEEAETTPPTLTTSSLADLRIAEKESMSIEIDDKGIERTEVKRRTKETATQTTQLTQEEEEEPTLQDVGIVERGAGSLIGSEWTEVKQITFPTLVTDLVSVGKETVPFVIDDKGSERTKGKWTEKYDDVREHKRSFRCQLPTSNFPIFEYSYNTVSECSRYCQELLNRSGKSPIDTKYPAFPKEVSVVCLSGTENMPVPKSQLEVSLPEHITAIDGKERKVCVYVVRFNGLAEICHTGILKSVHVNLIAIVDCETDVAMCNILPEFPHSMVCNTNSKSLHTIDNLLERYVFEFLRSDATDLQDVLAKQCHIVGKPQTHDTQNAEEIKEVLSDIEAMYFRSEVPVHERPFEIKEPKTLDDEVASKILEIEHTIGCGYSFSTLYVYVDEKLSQAKKDETKQNIMDILTKNHIDDGCMFKFVSQNVELLMTCGAQVKTMSELGTLGGFAIKQYRDEQQLELCALTARHVVEKDREKALYVICGEENLSLRMGNILQPLKNEHETLDIAAAIIDRGLHNTCNIQLQKSEGTRMFGSLFDYDTENVGKLNSLPVHIWGAKSQPGKGIILVPELRTTKGITYTVVANRRGGSDINEPFCLKGDSGSLVCADDRLGGLDVIGMLILGFVKDGKPTGDFCVIRLKDGLEQLSRLHDCRIRLCNQNDGQLFGI